MRGRRAAWLLAGVALLVGCARNPATGHPEMVFISVFADSSETPLLVRAMTPRKCPPRVALAGLRVRGVQISVVREGK